MATDASGEMGVELESWSINQHGQVFANGQRICKGKGAGPIGGRLAYLDLEDFARKLQIRLVSQSHFNSDSGKGRLIST